MQFILPTGLLRGTEYESAILELLLIPEAEMSVREKAKVDQASIRGEIYYGQYEELATGIKVFTTDLGDPESVVQIRLPNYVPIEAGIRMLEDLVEDLMELESK